MIFQRRPAFSLSGAYNKETKMVEIRWQAGFLPPVALGLSPESFFQFCDKIVIMWAPFIEDLKRMIEQGLEEDIKVELDWDEFERKMREHNNQEGE